MFVKVRNKDHEAINIKAFEGIEVLKVRNGYALSVFNISEARYNLATFPKIEQAQAAYDRIMAALREGGYEYWDYWDAL